MSIINKYHPYNVKINDWSNIEDQFNTWFGQHYQSNMAELVRHIINTKLSERLFGASSWDKLIISIYNPIEWNRESLHVNFDTEKDEWHFVYYATPFLQPEFVRTYPFEKGIEKFDQFIKMINW